MKVKDDIQITKLLFNRIIILRIVNKKKNN